MTHNHNTQSGAVFYYILLAVALIAALTYFVSRDNRASVGILSNDQARIAANEIIDYGNTVAQTVQKLKLRGCSDTEISFENSLTTSSYTNLNSPTDNSCHVFDVNAGNINVKEDFAYRAQIAFNGVGSTCADSSCVDLYISYRIIDENICRKINDALGITSFPTYFELTQGVFTGSYNYIRTNSHTLGNGKLEACAAENGGCLGEPSNNCYGYYKILIAR